MRFVRHLYFHGHSHWFYHVTSSEPLLRAELTEDNIYIGEVGLRQVGEAILRAAFSQCIDVVSKCCHCWLLESFDNFCTQTFLFPLCIFVVFVSFLFLLFWCVWVFFSASQTVFLNSFDKMHTQWVNSGQLAQSGPNKPAPIICCARLFPKTDLFVKGSNPCVMVLSIKFCPIMIHRWSDWHEVLHITIWHHQTNLSDWKPADPTVHAAANPTFYLGLFDLPQRITVLDKTMVSLRLLKVSSS